MLLNVSVEKKLSSDICNKTSRFCLNNLLEETASLHDKAKSHLSVMHGKTIWFAA